MYVTCLVSACSSMPPQDSIQSFGSFVTGFLNIVMCVRPASFAVL